MSYIIKIPSIEEMNKRWNYLINNKENLEDQYNWIIWKEKAIDNFVSGKTIPYYGFLNDEIICEATVILDESIVENPVDLVSDKRAYLSAFRTNKEYEGQGYFSKLFKYMINDLKDKGYEEACLGVEPVEKRNIEIYTHLGFTNYLKKEINTYPDGTEVEVDFYSKRL